MEIKNPFSKLKTNTQLADLVKVSRNPKFEKNRFNIDEEIY
jgi:hypothetical protein